MSTELENKTLSGAHIAVMSVAAGICVANIYYNQPILKNIADSFGATESKAGFIAVLSQAGYGLGLFFITPLGDKMDRKKLIVRLQLLLTAALAGMFFVRDLNGLYILSLLTGAFSVAAQVILPMAASLTTQNKGKTVGLIFTGILVGILAARIVSGFIAEWMGWRSVYGISACMVLVMTLVVQLTLPNVERSFNGTYANLLKSTLSQIGRFARLRRAALLGALVFGVFCSFWTTLTFHLSLPPFQYRTDTIGLFGILAIAGAMLAPVFGKLADKGNTARSQMLSVSMIAVAVVSVLLFPASLAALVVSVLLLDVGVQATQITNIAIIYTLDTAANSRINTVYMTTYFIGGSLGTFIGVQCWRLGGWTAVTVQLSCWVLVALLVVAVGFKRAVQQPSYGDQVPQ